MANVYVARTPWEKLKKYMMTQPAEISAETKPNALRSVCFLVLSFPIRLVEFIVVVTLTVVGLGTVIIWVGLPILAATTLLIRWAGDFERWWLRTILGITIPAPNPTPDTSNVLRRWQSQLVDARTWRDLGYLAIAFPLGILEFLLGVASVVLLPLAIWVAPWVAWLHTQLARTLLSPNENTQLKAKTRQLQSSRARGVDAAEAERRRIERDLHDGAQQRLVSLAMHLGRAKTKLDSDPNAARSLLDEAHTDAKLAVSELRDLARGIYPAILGDRGLDAALSAQAVKLPIPVSVNTDISPRPPAAVETTAYFIVSETLANIVKHSHATEAAIKVWRSADTVHLEISDNGHGGAEVTPGGGLAGLADRAATIDGTVSVFSPPGGPTTVRAELPCTW